MRRFRFLLPFVVTLLGLAPAARATDYCVAPNTTCGGTNVSTFEAALDAADNADNADRVFLGAATYTAPTASGYLYNDATGPVEVIGAGQGQTVLTGQLGGNTAVLRLLASAASSIHDLSVRLPQNAAGGLVGLETYGAAARISVEEVPSQANPRTGVRLHGGSLTDSTVTIGAVQNTTGVNFADGGESLLRATVGARQALVATYAGTVDRAILRGGSVAFQTYRGTSTITNTLATISESAGVAVAAGVQSGFNTVINLDGVTLVNLGPVPGSTGVSASNGLATSQTAAVHLVDAVLRGFESGAATSGSSPGQADITFSYSDYNPAGNSDSGPGSIAPPGATGTVSNLGDAKFVDATNGDYRLRFDSPLVEIGEPGAPTTTTDLGGGARLADGKGPLFTDPRRDIGAYEYQAQAPVAVISGPGNGQTGTALSYSGSGSSDPDPGDAITAYAWTVDGAPAGTSASISPTFTSTGTHVVGLTVTDSIGRQGTTVKPIEVTAPPAPLPGSTTDTTAPVLTKLAANPKTAGRAKRVKFTFELSEAADVRVVIERVLAGRKRGKSCQKPSKKNRKGTRCTRYVRVVVLTDSERAGAGDVIFSGRVKRKPVADGTYRMSITATDKAGNRSAVKRVTFRVRR